MPNYKIKREAYDNELENFFVEENMSPQSDINFFEREFEINETVGGDSKNEDHKKNARKNMESPCKSSKSSEAGLNTSNLTLTERKKEFMEMKTDVAFDSIGFKDSIKRLFLCMRSTRFCLSFLSLILSATIDAYGSVLWTEIASYYYKNSTSHLVSITISYKIVTNVAGRLTIGVILKKYDSVVCLIG